MLPEAAFITSDIERLYQNGFTAQEIADMTNVTKKIVENYIARRIKGDEANGNQ